MLIITPTNAGPAGARALNCGLHDLRCGDDERAELRGPVGERSAVEAPVLFRRNDHQRGQFDGSLARVLRIDAADRTMTCPFDDAEHDLAPGNQLDASWWPCLDPACSSRPGPTGPGRGSPCPLKAPCLAI